MNISKLDHIGIQTKNLDESVKFYSDNLGFTLLRKEEIPESNLRIAFLEREGAYVELLESRTMATSTGLKHICFLCENIEDAFDEIKRSEAKLLHNEVQVGKDCRFFFARFPDGEWIEFMEKKGR